MASEEAVGGKSGHKARLVKNVVASRRQSDDRVVIFETLFTNGAGRGLVFEKARILSSFSSDQLQLDRLLTSVFEHVGERAAAVEIEQPVLQLAWLEFP